MNIDKDAILNLLRSDAQGTQADQAQHELPEQVDTDQRLDRPRPGAAAGSSAKMTR